MFHLEHIQNPDRIEFIIVIIFLIFLISCSSFRSAPRDRRVSITPTRLEINQVSRAPPTTSYGRLNHSIPVDLLPQDC